jgi:hypothetical protein
VHGNRPKITSAFGKTMLKVMEFSLVGEDGVERAFTDFGFMARNRQGWYVFMPIELKMPAALSKVAGQFSEFEPRLQTAQALFALVDESGKRTKVAIEPSRLLFMRHDRAQVAVAPLSIKQTQEMLAKGSVIPSDDVASITEFDLRASESKQVSYYQVRLLVLRDWLEAIIRPITDPPRHP